MRLPGIDLPLRSRPPPTKTIFIHIPKTSGTSLGSAVRRVYPGKRCVFIYSHDPDHLESLRGKVQRAEALYGHFSFGIHDLFGVEARYVTILRRPVDRVVSFFRHQARHRNAEYHGRIADGMTLRDLLLGEQCHQVNNHMVRIISGHQDAGTTGDRGLLDQAEGNLAAHFDAVGVSERMDESIALIGSALGWTTQSPAAHLNADPDGASFTLDDETRAAILRYNALDIELYEGVVAQRFPFASDGGPVTATR